MAIENKKSMRPVEERYRNFCEHIAAVCEAEAKAYEEHPGLHDADFNSSALSVPNAMNGANNRVEWKTPIRIHGLDLQVEDALLSSGALIPGRKSSMNFPSGTA